MLLCCAGTVFLLVGTYLLFVAKKTLDKTMKQVDELLNEASTSITLARNTLGRVNLLMDRIVLSVDTLNLSLVKVDEVLSDVGACAHGVAQAGQVFSAVKTASVKKIEAVARSVADFSELYAGKPGALQGIAECVRKVMQSVQDRAGLYCVKSEQTQIEHVLAQQYYEQQQVVLAESRKKLQEAVVVQVASDAETKETKDE